MGEYVNGATSSTNNPYDLITAIVKTLEKREVPSVLNRSNDLILIPQWFFLLIAVLLVVVFFAIVMVIRLSPHRSIDDSHGKQIEEGS